MPGARSPAPARWTDRAALLGGGLSVSVGILILANPQYWRYDSPPDYLIAILEGVALLAVLGGLAGLRARQRGRYGRLGEAGFIAASAGTIMAGAGHLAGVPFFEFVNVGGMVYVLIGLGQGIFLFWGMIYVLGALCMSAGLVLLGIATARAGTLPVWCGAVLILGLAGLWTLGNAGGWISFGLSWLAVGYALRSEKRETANPP